MFAAAFGYDARTMRAFLGLLSLVVSVGLGGCGGCNDNNNVGHLPDAPPAPDAPLDAPLDMAPPGPVTVTVTQFGDPLMGLPVYFQESDSTLVRAALTGDDGTASAVLHAGGFVTVLQLPPAQARASAPGEGPPPPHTQLTTFAGVKGGDDLHLDLDPVALESTDITFDLSVPDEGLGRRYTLYSSCGTQTLTRSLVRAGGRAAGVGSGEVPPLTAPVTLTGCGGTADMLVVSSDSETQAVSWLYNPAVVVADGVAVNLTDAYQDATDVTFTYTRVAPILDGLTVQRELRSAHGSLGFVTNLRTATPDIATAIASVTEPLPGAAGLLAVTTTTDQPNAGHGQQTFFEWGGTGDYTIDYPAVALHGYASTPSVDVDSHAVLWTEAGGGVAPDFVFGSYDLSRTDDNGLNTWSWQIVAPYTAGQGKLTYPRLPATIYDYNPATGEEPALQRLTTVKAPGGYDAFRAHAFNVDPSNAVTGATGRIVFEEMFEPPVVDAKVTAPRRALSGRPVPRKR